MGSIYAREMLMLPNPTVGLLSIGEESTKGMPDLEAYELLSKSRLNFVGNVEGATSSREKRMSWCATGLWGMSS